MWLRTSKSQWNWIAGAKSNFQNFTHINKKDFWHVFFDSEKLASKISVLYVTSHKVIILKLGGRPVSVKSVHIWILEVILEA